MDPAIEHQDLRPPPEPRLLWAILLAIMVNVLLIAAVAWGIQWKGGSRHGEIAAAAPQHTASTQRAVPSAPLAQAHTACPLRPLLAAAGGKDGQVFPPADVEGKTEKDIDALLVAGKEAAAAGQVRDAEVDYLTSCRVADALKGAGSLESANARYQLARHYVAAATAASAAPAAQRAEVFGRAQAYYEDSLRRFRAEWGDSHEKTRFAADGLQAVRVALAQAQATQPGAGPEVVATARMGAGPASSAAPQEQPPQRQLPREQPRQPAAAQNRPIGKSANSAKAHNAPTASAPQRAALPQPSFDCRKARSYAERTICSDAELAQLDRELGRLHARAKQAAANPAAFRRQNDAEWHRREKTCRDRSCLLRWYAERRQQLAQSLSRASAQTDRTAAR